ncbi:MAG: EamA family transporter [Dissulfurimicrobium sp.]|uniref:EamA family transporter n=1 Tax=Dissulfurimicrobium sp. TaxID=2022436 RepID=UPI004048FAE5
MNKYLPVILLGVFLNAFAQLALKQGMRMIGEFAFSMENLISVGIKVVLNPYVILGLFFYVVSVVVWLFVLSRVDVSFAYPLLSVGYIVAAMFGMAFFGEGVGLTRWAGIIVICIGVYLITRSG